MGGTGAEREQYHRWELERVRAENARLRRDNETLSRALEELSARETRLREFVREVGRAAHRRDHSILEDATTLEQKAAGLLGYAWPYDAFDRFDREG